jgi:hypothetical protein
MYMKLPKLRWCLAILPCATLLLSGCVGDKELTGHWVSAEAIAYVNGHEIARTALSGVALDALSGWLNRHASGWHDDIGDLPLGPLRTSIDFDLKRRGGAEDSVSENERPDGSYYLLAISSHWTTTSDLIETRIGTREIRRQDAAELMRLAHVGAEHRPAGRMPNSLRGTTSGRSEHE